jgi:hypothetical protein
MVIIMSAIWNTSSFEYAAGGDLFDHTDPDCGMATWQAQKYFNQLTGGSAAPVVSCQPASKVRVVKVVK